MLSENLKALRKAKGLSQEDMAGRINVVRQTVSKWEKGLSVPDAEMLIQIADLFETSPGQLLGDTLDYAENTNAIAEQLGGINEQLAVKNRRSRRIWKTVAGILIGIVVFNIFLMFLSAAAHNAYDGNHNIVQVTEIFSEE